jgi:hypothetical protein
LGERLDLENRRGFNPEKREETGGRHNTMYLLIKTALFLAAFTYALTSCTHKSALPNSGKECNQIDSFFFISPISLEDSVRVRKYQWTINEGGDTIRRLISDETFDIE